jgi:hypothetical protein
VESETEKAYGNCKDNCIASIGKILKNHSGSLGNNLPACVNYWMS